MGLYLSLARMFCFSSPDAKTPAPQMQGGRS
jgi:hypothetical protein